MNDCFHLYHPKQLYMGNTPAINSILLEVKTKMSIEIGVSSACYYPLETEKALTLAGENGFKNVELFINSPSEIDDCFVGQLLEIKEKYGMHIVSVHPFSSFAESFFVFSDYERRYLDFLPFYEKFFKAANRLGADIFVFHGAKSIMKVDDSLYCKRYKGLIDLGKNYGIQVCHENVVDHKCESPQYMMMLRENIGKDFKIVLDVKQAALAHFTPHDFLLQLADAVAHVHISDRTAQKRCVTPFHGDFDFESFFKELHAYAYNGKCMIELYNWSYEDKEEIVEAYTKLTSLVETLHI